MMMNVNQLQERIKSAIQSFAVPGDSLVKSIQDGVPTCQPFTWISCFSPSCWHEKQFEDGSQRPLCWSSVGGTWFCCLSFLHMVSSCSLLDQHLAGLRLLEGPAEQLSGGSLHLLWGFCFPSGVTEVCSPLLWTSLTLIQFPLGQVCFVTCRRSLTETKWAAAEHSPCLSFIELPKSVSSFRLCKDKTILF